MTDTLSLKTVWQRLLAESPEVGGFQLGPLKVWVRQRESDCQLSFQHVPDDEDAGIRLLEKSCPEDATWRRVGLWEEMPLVELRPLFPSRPVVVRPEFPYTILPGERVKFYVGVPIVLSLRRREDPPFVQEPVLQLSNTWFGMPMDGELCFALRTQARREVDKSRLKPWRVFCPVRVKNQSKELLSLDRLCLRMKHLNLYEDADTGLWANESSVIFRGEADWSRVVVARDAPADLKAPRLWVKGEEEPRGRLLQRTLMQGKGLFL